MRRASVRNENGQSLVSILLILPLVLHLAAVTAIVGEAVSRRVALQTVADIGAWTGATVQATGQNQLAFLNSAMQWAWLTFTFPPVPGAETGSPLYPAFKTQQAGTALPFLPASSLTYIPTVECNVADAWIATYTSARTILGAAYDLENVSFALLARQEARRLSDLNAKDLFPGEQLRYAEYATTPTEILETGGILPFAARNPGLVAHTPQVRSGSPLQAGVLDRLPPWIRHVYLVPATRTLRYSCVTIKRLRVGRSRINLYFYQSNRVSFDVWRAKTPRRLPGLPAQPVDSFVWLVTAPAIKVPILSDLLGGALIPAMTAAAVAKPVGGSIAKGDDSYVAKLIPVASVMAGRQRAGRPPAWVRSFDSLLSRFGVIYDTVRDRTRLVAH